MSKNDRTLIASLLKDNYPAMAEANSEQWHALLNAETGLSIPEDEPNASAFDKWRQALTEQGKAQVWGVAPEHAAQKKARLKALLEQQDKLKANESDLLARLRLEAPGQAVQR